MNIEQVKEHIKTLEKNIDKEIDSFVNCTGLTPLDIEYNPLEIETVGNETQISPTPVKIKVIISSNIDVKKSRFDGSEIYRN